MGTLSLNLKLALGAVLFLIICLVLIFWGNSQGGFDPIAATVLGLPIHWYGLTMGAAILAGVYTALRINRHYFHLNEDLLAEALIAAIIGGIIGARLLFVLLKWPDYQDHLIEIIYLNRGGLSIHGALLGGAIGLWLRVKKDFPNFANLFAISLPLSQAIGRLGNFFNQEAYGGPTTLPWKMYVESPNRPAGLEDASYFHPTFMYEGVLNFLIFIVLLHLARTGKKQHLTLTYLILYSGVRFVSEFFRIDSDKLFSLTIAQWASLFIILAGYLLIKKPWISKP